MPLMHCAQRVHRGTPAIMMMQLEPMFIKKMQNKIKLQKIAIFFVKDYLLMY